MPDLAYRYADLGSDVDGRFLPDPTDLRRGADRRARRRATRWRAPRAASSAGRAPAPYRR